MKTLLTTSALILAGLTASVAFAAPVAEIDSSIGPVLVGENGMTLYTFKKDKENVSNCNGGCAQKWPPLMAADDATASNGYTIIKRKDGTHQWAKGGMPLYFWVKDTKAGDVTGDGVKGVWDAARP
jgi:predicted lipoprotein with Yx(FWY)xxD motif